MKQSENGEHQSTLAKTLKFVLINGVLKFGLPLFASLVLFDAISNRGKVPWNDLPDYGIVCSVAGLVFGTCICALRVVKYRSR